MRDDAEWRAKLLGVIDAHKPIPTDRLKEKLAKLAALHQLAEEESDADVPVFEVTVCILISLIREVLMYRDLHGLIDLPGNEWEFEE